MEGAFLLERKAQIFEVTLVRTRGLPYGVARAGRVALDYQCTIWYNRYMNSSIEKRKKIVKQAIANERLEGLKVSLEARKIADSYITGRASAKAAAAKIRARYGNL
jgi:hypothetical protein